MATPSSNSVRERQLVVFHAMHHAIFEHFARRMEILVAAGNRVFAHNALDDLFTEYHKTLIESWQTSSVSEAFERTFGLEHGGKVTGRILVNLEYHLGVVMVADLAKMSYARLRINNIGESKIAIINQVLELHGYAPILPQDATPQRELP
jgi:hypothetical protein